MCRLAEIEAARLVLRHAADERIPQTMAGIEDGDHFLVAVEDLNLRHEARIGRFLEDRFDAVGLRAHAVDGGDLGAVGQRVDVVADIGVGRREDHPALALHRHELLLQVQRDRTVLVIGP